MERSRRGGSAIQPAGGRNPVTFIILHENPRGSGIGSVSLFSALASAATTTTTDPDTLRHRAPVEAA